MSETVKCGKPHHRYQQCKDLSKTTLRTKFYYNWPNIDQVMIRGPTIRQKRVNIVVHVILGQVSTTVTPETAAGSSLTAQTISIIFGSWWHFPVAYHSLVTCRTASTVDSNFHPKPASFDKPAKLYTRQLFFFFIRWNNLVSEAHHCGCLHKKQLRFFRLHLDCKCITWQ